MSMFRNYKMWWNIYTSAFGTTHEKHSMARIPFLLDGEERNMFLTIGVSNYNYNITINFQIVGYFTYTLTLRTNDCSRRPVVLPANLERPLNRDITLQSDRMMDDAEHVMTMFLLSRQDDRYDL